MCTCVTSTYMTIRSCNIKALADNSALHTLHILCHVFCSDGLGMLKYCSVAVYAVYCKNVPSFFVNFTKQIPNFASCNGSYTISLTTTWIVITTTLITSCKLVFSLLKTWSTSRGKVEEAFVKSTIHQTRLPHAECVFDLASFWVKTYKNWLCRVKLS